MKRIMIVPALLLAVVFMARPVSAEPAWGNNCLSCHGQLQQNWLFVFGEDTTADPDESNTGAPDRGTLPVFQAYRGTTKTLQAQLAELAPDDTYAVALRRLRFRGVETGGQLTYTGDCAWPEWGEHANYYSDPIISYRWGNGPTAFEFDIDVGADADFDYYDLVFAVAGKSAFDGGLFYAREHFSLLVMGMPGDLNCDGTLNAFDIDPFVLALTDPAGYAAAYPDCDIMRGDINRDGRVDSFDIDPFVELLIGG